jgi:Tfp pilus assembly protein PilN
MADGLKVEILTRDFNRMLEELAAIDPRVEFAHVVDEAATRVIAGAMRRTRAATAGGIRRDHEAKEWTTFNGKKYHIAVWRLPDPLWGEIAARRRESLQTKLNARGLSKQSWVHVAAALGRTVAAPAYVLNANYRGQQYPIDGAATSSGSGTNYARTIINSSPIVQAAGGRAALLGAMRGEINYFRRNMAHHFYRTQAGRAAKYPGIFTSPVPAAA